MPRVVYGLIGAHRSHRIDSPEPSAPSASSRPDACTLCHVDKPRAWAAAALASWASGERRERVRARPTADGATSVEPSEATRLLLAGDPIERALAADALGRRVRSDTPRVELARRAGLLLDALRDDDYPAVRAIAWRSLRALLSTSVPDRVPPVTAFTPTDDRERRLRSLSAITAQLPRETALPVPAEIAAARTHSTDIAIFIGE
jgi:hypothetical protein